MRKVSFYTLFLLIALISAALAQFTDKAELNAIKKDYLGLKPADKPFTFIDLSKLHWSHSYSMTFYSGGSTSGSVGLYTSSVLYEISPSLLLNLKLGIAHNPGSLFNRTVSTDAAFLPGARLDYRPSKDFRISIGFNTYPGTEYYPYSPYRNRYWRR
ncbi:MAG: hypothetical protein JSV44_00715 [Candidatus Zixiibacteriota bacterium]|nr:MAG: hypothetical protein JSV44_00715 [candidate division Zixibacteria bacterium]